MKNRRIRMFLICGLLCLSVCAARAWDMNKPFIYEMRIAFETDNWINMYSTATVLSKSDNAVAFRVVAYSTTTPAYQFVVTTQGLVGISTGAPQAKFHVSGGDIQVGDASASTISSSGYMTFANLTSSPTAAAGRVYYDSLNNTLRLSTGTDSAAWANLPTVAEGDWTAGFATSVSGSITISESAKTGHYIKIGKLVTLTGSFTISSVSNPVGSVRITGLPFSNGTGEKHRGAVAIWCDGLTSGAATQMVGDIPATADFMYIYQFAAGASNAQIASEFQANTVVTITASYITDW